MNNKLLSICIPTYNRDIVLDNTLKTLFSNPDFDEDKIEVIVSDNCSSDNTKNVVTKYPLVKYYRNKENVRDLNFRILLEYASGEYIKLANDTLSFKPMALKFILENIEKHLIYKKNIVFYQNMFVNKNCAKEINNLDSYLKEASFYSTWIANFGIWQVDFKKIVDKDKYVKMQFTQVDWTFQTIKNKRDTVIFFGDFFEIFVPNNKGGYNIIETFVKNYLKILKNERVTLIRYEIEKYYLCRYFVFPWLTSILITEKSKFSFETNNLFTIVFKKYWYEPYFYILLSVFSIRKIMFKA